MQGLRQIASGLSNPDGGVKEGPAAVLTPDAGLPFALAGVTESKQGLQKSLADGGPLDQLIGGAGQVKAGLGSSLQLNAGLCQVLPAVNPAAVPAETLAPLQAGCAGLLPKADALNGGAAAVEAGVKGVKTNTAASLEGSRPSRPASPGQWAG